MAVILAQSNLAVSGASSNSLVVTLPNTTQSGSTILAHCLANATGGTLSVSDNINAATYTRDTLDTWVSTATISTLRLSSNQAGSGFQATLNWSGAASTFRIIIEEWTGLSNTPFDQATALKNTANNTTFSSNATGVLQVPGELVVVHVASQTSGTWTAGSGFTIDPGLPQPKGGTAEYEIAASTSPVTANISLSTTSTNVGMVSICYMPVPIPTFFMGQACL